MTEAIATGIFTAPRFETLGGRALRDVRVGWRSAGRLNAERSNAILVTHHFSGSNHAFGPRSADDPTPGFWDAIIGPGKAVDTQRFFVLASDTLVNLNVGDPQVTTTGPAAIDPDTGRPYGLSFPVVTIGDFVNLQKRLVESLGVSRLHAVMGPSMGALQTYDWAARHPGMVGRIMPAIASAEANPWLIAWLDVWASPIRLDPRWNGGDYYGGEPPLAGLTQALKAVTLHALHWDWAQANFGQAVAGDGAPEAGVDPARSIAGDPAIVEALERIAAERARLSDANHLLYLARANQTFAPGGAKTLAEAARLIRAPTLLIYSPTDQVFLADWVRATAAALAAAGVSVDTLALNGPNGHLDGLLAIGQASERIRAFLAD